MEKTSTGAARTKTDLNKIRIPGKVPDRGGVFEFLKLFLYRFLIAGRPDQIEAPPPEMPPWQKERAQGGGGFRGGHRGGGDAGEFVFFAILRAKCLCVPLTGGILSLAGRGRRHSPRGGGQRGGSSGWSSGERDF